MLPPLPLLLHHVRRCAALQKWGKDGGKIMEEVVKMRSGQAEPAAAPEAASEAPAEANGKPKAKRRP